MTAGSGMRVGSMPALFPADLFRSPQSIHTATVATEQVAWWHGPGDRRGRTAGPRLRPGIRRGGRRAGADVAGPRRREHAHPRGDRAVAHAGAGAGARGL